MARLKEEYTDTGNRTHQVEHILVPSDEKNSRERIIQELFQVLSGAGKKLSD